MFRTLYDDTKFKAIKDGESIGQYLAIQLDCMITFMYFVMAERGNIFAYQFYKLTGASGARTNFTTTVPYLIILSVITCVVIYMGIDDIFMGGRKMR